MIIENGHIEIAASTAGGFDENHFPIPAEQAEPESIPCQYSAKSVNLLAKSGTTGDAYTQASYTILIEEREFKAERLSLYDKDGDLVGEFSIISVAPLEAVGQIQITV